MGIGDNGFRSADLILSAADRMFQQALAHHEAGRWVEAETLYRQVLHTCPEDSDALRLLGLIYLQAGQPATALPLFDKAIQGRPSFADAYAARGDAFYHLQQYQPALMNYDEAIRLDPRFAEAYTCRGAALLRLQQYQAATESCDRAIRLNPGIAEPWSIRGAALSLLQQYQAALESSNQAIALKVHYADAHSNRGAALQGLGQYDAALDSYDTAIRLNPSMVEAWTNRGNVLFYRLRNYPAALESFDHAMLLQPDRPYVLGMRVLSRLTICDWEGIESQCRQIEASIERSERVADPFVVLSISGSADVQRKAAEILARDQFPARSTAPFQRRPRRDKIRIGYFSADFHEHPMCSLMAEVFERHDRTRFEILAFSFGPDQTDEMGVRVFAAMDRVLHVRSMPDREVARLSRELEVDIAVDLMGFSDNCRTGIFVERASPIQVSYLGYVGTMGAQYIDYIIADLTVIPEASRRYYSEKIVYMPDCYQANDTRRMPSTALYTRAAEGLPENGFVYCCFNSTFKIAPANFDLWMRILREADGSVLWLLESNPWAADNLRKEAVRHGVAPNRLIFAKALPFAEYVTRQSLADLFLDTSPYNAGATAGHALWAGLPVLTRMGEAFAGRMAASLLRAIGLPELVTSSDADYVALAVELACKRERHCEIREKLKRNRITAPLFDVSGFCRHLESGYSAMYERYQTDLPPDHIHIQAAHIKSHWSQSVRLADEYGGKSRALSRKNTT